MLKINVLNFFCYCNKIASIMFTANMKKYKNRSFYNIYASSAVVFCFLHNAFYFHLKK